MRSLSLVLLLLAPLCLGSEETARDDLPLSRISLPEGFEIALYCGEVPGARSLALGENGTVFVGTREVGSVYAIRDRNGDGRAEEVFEIASGLRMPNGVAFRGGSLFVAEMSRVIRFDGIEARLADPPKPVVVSDKFPKKRHHGWKFIAFGPDGLLYVPVGAPGNVVKSEDPRFASIMRMKPDGTALEVFASGVRNTVGFDWHPDTKELWFTDNGRDWLGDDSPPDELNRAPEKGLHFGYPHWHGKGTRDPEYGEGVKREGYVFPERELGPHVAALGMRFYVGAMFPKEYVKRIFIAEHGSWNRSKPIGYRVMSVRLEEGKAASYEVFAEGWLTGGKAWGRPVDLMELPDGSMLLSDDRAGAVYRITYRKP